MKKILSALIAVYMLAGLTACGTPPGIASESQTSSQINQQSVASYETDKETDTWLYSSYESDNTDTESDSEASDEDTIPPDASEYAVELYNKYVELSAENGFNVSSVSRSNSFTEFSLIFEDFENYVSFYEDEKSFKVSIYNDVMTRSQIKEVIAKVLMGLDDITLNEATEISQNIANSYSNDTFSDTIDIGDYLVVLLPDESEYSNTFKYLKCVHKDELWKDVNKNEYPIVDRAMYEAPELNSGEKCKITGTVTNWYIEPLPAGIYEGTAIILGEDGNSYICAFSYKDKPLEMEINRKYTIYGSIEKSLEDTPYIYIDYPEKLD